MTTTNTKLPKIMFGVLGRSASGKSPLINAIFGRSMLPPSDCRQCTTIPIEISATANETASIYEANIELITKDELSDLIDRHKADLRLLDELRMSNTEMNDSYEDISQRVEYDREHLHALLPNYGFIDTMKTAILVNSLDIDTLIVLNSVASTTCKTKSIKCDDLAIFREQIEYYLDDNNLLGPRRYTWLVQSVKIFIKTDILPPNIVVVDLPGSHATEIPRRGLIREYVNKFDYYISVAATDEYPGHLSVDDDLFSTSRKSLLTNMCYVLSKSDERSYGNDKDEVRKEILKSTLFDVKYDSILQKYNDSSKLISRIDDAIAKLTTLFDDAIANFSRNRDLPIVIRHYNRLDKLREAKTKMETLLQEYWIALSWGCVVHQCKEQVERILQTLPATTRAAITQDQVNIFCVSAYAFLSKVDQGNYRGKKMPAEFETVASTGIPAILHWILSKASENYPAGGENWLTTQHSVFTQDIVQGASYEDATDNTRAIPSTEELDLE